MSLHEGYPAQFQEWLQKDEIDLAITLIEKKAAPEIQSLGLLELPLVLLVEKKQRHPVGGGIVAARKKLTSR